MHGQKNIKLHTLCTLFMSFLFLRTILYAIFEIFVLFCGVIIFTNFVGL